MALKEEDGDNRPLGEDPVALKEDDGDNDFGDGDEAAYSDDGGDGDGLLADRNGERNALILKDGEATRSYSSIRFSRSSSDLIETKASKSSVGN